MSQVNLNNEQQVNFNAGAQQPQGIRQHADLPPELQNARPSTSVWAKIGRVAEYVARALIAIPTLGLSELAIRGIRKLCTKAHASDIPPQPRVRGNRPAMLPLAEPRADADNTALKDGMLKLNLPQRHLDSLRVLLDDMALRYGGIAPRNLDELRKLMTHTEPFVRQLRRAVDASAMYVDPARLQRLAREILEPEMIRRSIGDLLREKAQSLGMQLRPEGIRQATEIFFQSCRDKISDRPMGTLRDNIESFLNYEGMGNTHMVKDAFHRMAKHVDAADVLQRAALQDGLETDSLPPAHRKALDDMLKGLRDAYGQDCLPTDMPKLLRTHLGTGDMLLDKLKQMARKAKAAIAPQAFADAVRDMLTPVARRHAMSQALGELLEKGHGLRLHPRVLPALLDALLERCPALKENLPGVTSAETARQALADLDGEVSPFLAEVAGNVKAVEEQCLTAVSPEIRPVLQNLIRSLPFDNAGKAQSRAMVDRFLRNMPAWKASIPLGDKSLDAFCAKMTDELNIRMQTLAGEDRRFNGNIYGTFRDDTNRNTWVFNGTVFDHRPTDEVISGFEQIVPAAVDRQFLSKLANQYLDAALQEPLKGVMLPNPNDPQQSEVHHVWQYSGDEVQEEQRSNGLTFRTIGTIDALIQPGKVDMPNDGQYSITVAGDGKSAVVEMIVPSVIVTDNAARLPVGAVRHVMRVQCELSGGAPDVRPRVTGVQISQTVSPLDI